MSEAKSYIRTVVSKDGSERLQFLGIVAKEGFSFYVNRIEVGADGKPKTVATGARSKEASLAEVMAKVDSGVKNAKEKGWVSPAGPRGFKAKENEFDLTSLPAPKGAAPAPAPAPEGEAPAEAPAPPAPEVPAPAPAGKSKK